MGIDTSDNVAIVYDSLTTVGDYREYYSIINNFAKYEYQQSGNSRGDLKYIASSGSSEKQTNGDDCGIFTLINLTRFLLMEVKPSYKIQFNGGESRIQQVR